MNIYDQVCSLELAKRLKELGVMQQSIFGWIHHEHSEAQAWACEHVEPNASWFVITGTNDHKPITWSGDDKENAAFTVAELGELLPPSCNYAKICGGRSGLKEIGWCCYNLLEDGIREKFIDVTEANCRAKALIHLIESGMIRKRNYENDS